MINSFKNKGLKELFETGKSRRVRPDLHARALMILDVLDQADDTAELNVPGFDFHGLRGYRPKRYSVHINGPWCITFEFADGEARRVNLEQYH